MFYKAEFNSPIGSLGLLASKEKLLKISFKGIKDIVEDAKEDQGRFVLIFKELDEYFNGKRKKFNKPLNK